jgi:hypothetical protein
MMIARSGEILKNFFGKNSSTVPVRVAHEVSGIRSLTVAALCLLQ